MTTTPNQTTREEISGEMREKADQVAAALRNLHGLPVIATESDTQPGRSALWMDNGMAGAGQVAISTGEFPCAQTTALATLVNVAASFDFDALIAALQSPTDREGDRREWRPIESAPKDGTPILAFGPLPGCNADDHGWHGVRETKWKCYPKGSPGYAAYERGEGPLGIGWDWYESVHNWSHSWKPTHWMPLPEAPAHLSRSIVGEGE